MSDQYMIQNNTMDRPLYVKRVLRANPPVRSRSPRTMKSTIPNVLYTDNPGDAMIFSYQELLAIDTRSWGSPIPAVR